MVLVGTTKARSSCARTPHAGGGSRRPHLPGSRSTRSRSISAAAAPAVRGRVERALRPRAPLERRLGRTWTNPERADLRFPEDTGAELKRIWQIVPGREDEPNRSTAASSRPRCSSPRTPARPGRSCGACGTTRIGRSGSRAAAACACTRSSPIPCIAGACWSRSRPAASTAATTAARPGGAQSRRARRVHARQASRVRAVRAQGRPASDVPRAAVPPESLGPLSQRGCRRIVDRTSRTACLRTSASRWRFIRTIRETRVHRADRVRRSSAARPRASCACIARATPARPGSRSRAGCRRRTRSSGAARRMGTDPLESRRRLFRYAERQGVRLAERRQRRGT